MSFLLAAVGRLLLLAVAGPKRQVGLARLVEKLRSRAIPRFAHFVNKY